MAVAHKHDCKQLGSVPRPNPGAGSGTSVLLLWIAFLLAHHRVAESSPSHCLQTLQHEQLRIFTIAPHVAAAVKSKLERIGIQKPVLW